MAENLAALQLFSAQLLPSADPAVRAQAAPAGLPAGAAAQGFPAQLAALLGADAAVAGGAAAPAAPLPERGRLGALGALEGVVDAPEAAPAEPGSGNLLPPPGSGLPPTVLPAPAAPRTAPVTVPPGTAFATGTQAAEPVATLPAAPAEPDPLAPSRVATAAPEAAAYAEAAAAGNERRPDVPVAQNPATQSAVTDPADEAVRTTSASGVVSSAVPGAGLPRPAVSRGRELAAGWAVSQPNDTGAAAERLESVRVTALAETAAGQFSLASRSADGALLVPVAGGAESPGVPAPPTAAAQLAESLRTPLGTQEWSQGLGQRLLVMAEQGIEAARLRLNPASLGPLDIQISVDDDRAQVVFGAQHAATRDALEEALPRLRELFAAQGMELIQAEVRDQDAGSPGERGSPGMTGQDLPVGDSMQAVNIETGILLRPDRAQGSVDIYV